MGVLRHLNNVALSGVYKEARMRFGAFMDTRSHWDTGHRVVAGEVAIRHLGEGRHPEPILVDVNMAESRARPLPDALRAMLAAQSLIT